MKICTISIIVRLTQDFQLSDKKQAGFVKIV